MEWEEIESELVAVADRLGVEVRHVRYEGDGGLCVLRGRQVLIVNDALGVPERVGVMARGLAGLPGIGEMYIVPEVRGLLERYASEGQD